MADPFEPTGPSEVPTPPTPATPPTPPGPPESLMRTTVRGIGLAGAGYIGSQVLNFLAYLVLVRLLDPKDFGLYAAGTVITGITSLFAESGMLAALITRKDRIDEAASTAFVSLALTGIALTCGSLAVSPLLGLAFHSGEVTMITAVLSGWLFVRALTIVPDALLQRQFSFARRVIVDPAGVLAYAAASIPLAATGAGVWAMVAGSYASILTQAIGAWVACGFRPKLRLATFAMWRELASFSRLLVIGEIVYRVKVQIDTFMLGRFSGAATLGQYRNGMMLASQPSAAFGAVAAYVILPAFARISFDTARLASAARRGFAVTEVAIVPVAVACIPLGVPVAVILMGGRWRVAGHVIAGLCGLVFGNAMISVSGELMKAMATLRLQLVAQILWFVLTAVTVTVAALLWGALAVAIAVSLSTCVTAAFLFVRIAIGLSLPVGELLVELLTTLIAAAVMAVAIWALNTDVDVLARPELVGVLVLIGDGLVGLVVYTATLVAIDPQRRAGGLSLARRLRARIRPGPAPG
jgi:O-antigen/teichoic acid export membrane protein